MKNNENIKNKFKFGIAISKIKEEDTNIMNKKFNNIVKKGCGIAACLIVVSSGVVFAKDIENYFRSLFNNSSKAIDVAVENGYIQKEEMDYSYDEDIGIKVDNLVLDDLNLDISFNFEIKKENVKSIRLNNFIITNDNEKVVYQSEFKTAETLEELPLYNSVNWMNAPVKLTDTTFTDSILFGLRPEKEDFKELRFDIKSVDIVYTDDKREVIDGTWKFNVTINDEMRQNENAIYTLAESNDYIETCTATMSKTGMIIEFTTKVKIPQDIQFPWEMVRLKSNNGIIYDAGYTDWGEYKMKIHFENVGTFTEDSDKLELELDFFDTTLALIKTRQSANVIYTLAESNEYIESCTATMSNTGTIIELTSKVKIPTNRFIQDTISLSSNSATYEGGYIDFNEERMKIHFENVSNFIENADILNLHLGFFNTTVVLVKESI